VVGADDVDVVGVVVDVSAVIIVVVYGVMVDCAVDDAVRGRVADDNYVEKGVGCVGGVVDAVCAVVSVVVTAVGVGGGRDVAVSRVVACVGVVCFDFAARSRLPVAQTLLIT
jgi:hypothetical protein